MIIWIFILIGRLDNSGFGFLKHNWKLLFNTIILWTQLVSKIDSKIIFNSNLPNKYLLKKSAIKIQKLLRTPTEFVVVG